MVTQPKECPGGYIDLYIDSHSWTGLLGDFKARELLVLGLSSDVPKNLTHLDYSPLGPLIRDLAAVLVVDQHWLPESNV
jgi:hypothetical protein